MKPIKPEVSGTLAAIAGVKIPRNLRRVLYPTTELYRVTPMFPDSENPDKVVGSGLSYVIDGHINEATIVSVPVSTTMREASDIEAMIVNDTKKPCLVVTNNVTFLKTERLQPDEINKILGHEHSKIEDLAADEETEGGEG